MKFLLFLACVPLMAQSTGTTQPIFINCADTNPPTCAPVLNPNTPIVTNPNTPIVTPPQQPSTFYGVAISGLPQSSPKFTGAAFLAIQVNAKNDVWSFTEGDATLVKGLIVTQVRSGGATSCKTFGAIKVYCLADAGAATNGASSGPAGALGAVLYWPMKRSHLGASAWLVGFRSVKTTLGPQQWTWQIGLGGKP